MGDKEVTTDLVEQALLAKDILAEKWVQGNYFYSGTASYGDDYWDLDYDEVIRGEVEPPGACLYGSLFLSSQSQNYTQAVKCPLTRIFDKWWALSQDQEWVSAADWNDADGRTKEEVLDKMDEFISWLKSKQEAHNDLY